MLAIFIFVFILTPVLVTAGILWAMKRDHQRLINPLTKHLRRPPGLHLHRQLSGEQIAAMRDMLGIVMPGVIPLILVYEQITTRPTGAIQTTWIAVVLMTWLVWEFYAVGKLARRFKRIKNLQLGYECELAVGQELDLLMRDGFQVFHDVEAENFNIDHIVVGPPGVFAVETKGRSKILSGDGQGKKQYRVTYRRGVLEFPNGSDSESIPQATRQAAWVSTWLSQATGQPVSVSPVVVLPGWYVETQDTPDVPVIASGSIRRHFLKQSAQRLAGEDISKIVYQIEQRVRDLPPSELIRPLPST